MMSVIARLLSLVSSMTIRMLKSRSNLYVFHMMGNFSSYQIVKLSILSLMTEDITPEHTTLTSKMNLISLNTSLEIGLSSSALKYHQVNGATKVTIP